MQFKFLKPQIQVHVGESEEEEGEVDEEGEEDEVDEEDEDKVSKCFLKPSTHDAIFCWASNTFVFFHGEYSLVSFSHSTCPLFFAALISKLGRKGNWWWDFKLMEKLIEIP